MIKAVHLGHNQLTDMAVGQLIVEVKSGTHVPL